MSDTEWLCLEEVDVGSKELMVINLLLGPDAELPICITELGMSMRSLGRRQIFFFYSVLAWYNSVLEGIICLFKALSKCNILSNKMMFPSDQF